MKTELAIQSPSRVFAGIGEQINAGLVEGLRASSPGVEAVLRSLVAPPSVDAIAALSAGSGAASTYNTSTTHTDARVFNWNPQFAEKPDSSEFQAQMLFTKMVLGI
jgi:hypothetical protein